MEQAATRGRWAFGMTLLAFAWGVALLVAAFVLPVYSSSTASGASVGSVDLASSSTLVAVNGLWVVAPVGLPTLVAAVVWFALHRKCSRGSRPSAYVAWTLIGLLIAFGLLASASIGMFVVPGAALLAGAAALTPSRTPPGHPSVA